MIAFSSGSTIFFQEELLFFIGFLGGVLGGVFMG
jgi:hypothetical protein